MNSSMAMLFLFAVVTLPLLCKAREMATNNDIQCNGAENCSCFAQYTDLEKHIEKNETLLDYLRESFYKGGKDTEFARLYYEFTTYDCTSNESYDRIEKNYYSSQYIWSSSFIYLFGPDPLFYSSIYVIFFPVDTNITIHLPCICEDKYEDLLSTLTSMVS